MAANNERRASLPGQCAQGLHVWTKCEITKSSVPTCDLETVERVHLHIHRQQVIAPVRAVLKHGIEKYVRSKAFTDQSAKGIRKGNNDRVNRPGAYLSLKLLEVHCNREVGPGPVQPTSGGRLPRERHPWS